MIPDNYHRHINPDGTEGGLVHNGSDVPDSVTVPVDCIVPERCKVAPNTTLPSGVLLRISSSVFDFCYSGLGDDGNHYYTAGCETGVYSDLLYLYNNPKDEWVDSEGNPHPQNALDEGWAIVELLRKKIEGL